MNAKFQVFFSISWLFCKVGNHAFIVDRDESTGSSRKKDLDVHNWCISDLRNRAIEGIVYKV